MPYRGEGVGGVGVGGVGLGDPLGGGTSPMAKSMKSAHGSVPLKLGVA